MSGFTAGETYKVRITGYNGSTAGTASAEVSFTMARTSSISTEKTPSQVTGVRVTATATSVTIRWNRATNATQYQVDVWIPGIGWVEQPKTSSLNKTITGFSKGTTYKIRVTAYNGNTAGKTSSEVTFRTSGNAVDQVTNVKASATGNAVRVTWDKISNATQYKVDILIPGIGWVSQGKVRTLYKDISGLSANTTYKVRVTAYNGNIAGVTSNEVSFTTTEKVSVPGTVTNIQITNIGQKVAKITFNKATNATTYEVLVKSDSTSYKSIGKTPNTYINLTNLDSGTNYYVKIIAYNGVTPGAESAEIKFTTTSATSTYTWPVPGYTTITSKYGMRWHPISKEYKKHNGIDIPVPTGTQVLAAADGKIILANNNHTSYGKFIMIQHNDGTRTLYAHGSKLVKTSGTVKAGEVIMLSGNTGNSTGPHLHFEVYKYSATKGYYETVDPEAYFVQKSGGAAASVIIDL